MKIIGNDNHSSFSQKNKKNKSQFIKNVQGPQDQCTTSAQLLWTSAPSIHLYLAGSLKISFCRKLIWFVIQFNSIYLYSAKITATVTSRHFILYCEEESSNNQKTCYEQTLDSEKKNFSVSPLLTGPNLMHNHAQGGAAIGHDRLGTGGTKLILLF